MIDGDALVLLSGGQDSATCLAWALARFRRVETIGFAYGQRHAVELDRREALRQGMAGIKQAWAARLAFDHTISIGALSEIGGTALTSEAEIALREDGLPNTFVPGRNILMLTLAAALANRRGVRHLVAGMCETDYSGYPDCRDDAIKSLQATLNIGMATRLVIHTPLMWLDKRETWELARELGGDPLVELIRWESHTCYLGDRSRRHRMGFWMRIMSGLQTALRRVGEVLRPVERGVAEPDRRAKQRLQWLLDAPLFADEKLIGDFFDAVVRPEFEVQSREVGSSTETARRRLTGGEATGSVQAGIPFIGNTNITAKAKHEWERGTKETQSRKVTQVAVNSIGRRLEEIATLYVSKYPDRVVFLDSDGTITTFDGRAVTVDELEASADEPPRMLVFLEVAPQTPIMPMACELLSGRVVLLYERYINKVFTQRGESVPEYPSDANSNANTRAAYWRALTEAFKSRAAMEVVESAGEPDGGGRSDKLAWIDFRAPVGGTHTLHLHCVPDGRAHTGVFGYNFVRRGFRQGVRIVGTLKAGLDVNALAIFDR